jgi:hypothetical protein
MTGIKPTLACWDDDRTFRLSMVVSKTKESIAISTCYVPDPRAGRNSPL